MGSQHFAVDSGGHLFARAVTNCARGATNCPEPLARKPLFEGFGLHQLVVIGGAVLATTVGLIVLTWLFVVITGANRDYELARASGAPTAVRVLGGDDGTRPRSGGQPLRAPQWQIRPSTWFGVAVVFAAALGTATWIALGAEPERSLTGATAPTASAAPAASPSSVPAVACAKPPIKADYLPAGFEPALVAGFGGTTPAVSGCYFHWQGTGGLVTLIPTGDSIYGPRGEQQSPVRRNNRTLWAGTTPQGAAGVVVEEREFGGTPDIWYTLVSASVSQDELVSVAAALKLTK